MSGKILIVNGSPKKDGNTAALVRWFGAGCRAKGGRVEVVRAALLKSACGGCISCRKCQTRPEYACVIEDEVAALLRTMARADAIVLATPLYFFSVSAQLKAVIDRMFSLYKWDNRTDTFTSPLRGKRLVLLASAYEDTGLDALERPFRLIADYTGMRFASLLVPNAGVSGQIEKMAGIARKARALGKKTASQ